MTIDPATLAMLAIFIPTFIVVSITPGMCMTLSLMLGMTIGVKRTMWMMAGELIGVGTIAVLSVLGVASVMVKYPQVFAIMKYIGGAYLVYLGVIMWQAKGKLSLTNNTTQSQISNKALFSQGLITALSNPKGWAFMVAFLPPFINAEQAILPQLSILLLVIIVTEYCSLMIYASGGKSLKVFLTNDKNVKLINRISACVMAAIGFLLAFG